MDRKEIEAMQAGPEMNDLIATDVMGWAIGDRGAHYIGNDGKNLYYVIRGEFEPSEDIAAAWRVIEADTEAHWEISKGKSNYQAVFVSMHSNPVITRAETAPLAICRAALLATLR